MSDSNYVGFSKIHKNYLKNKKGVPEPLRDRKLAERIFRDANKLGWKHMVEDLGSFKPPHGFGIFMVVERKNKGPVKYVDWVETRKTGKKVWSIDPVGIRHGVHWESRGSTFKYNKFYRLKFSRGDSKTWGYRYINVWKKKLGKEGVTYRSNIKP